MTSPRIKRSLWTLAVPLFYTHLCCCFNLDSQQPLVFHGEAAAHFGHRVCQFGQAGNESVVVSAPLQANRTGHVYSCRFGTGQCERISLPGDAGIAMGLTLACDNKQLAVCGPQLQHDCDPIPYLNGFCVLLGPGFAVKETLRPAFQECRDSGLDAVILFDDSQSISDTDFQTMIQFIKDVLRNFTDPKSQVAVAQYSTNIRTVFSFNTFVSNRNPNSLLRNVPHTQGQTHTPSAIKYVLDNVFTKEQGMRQESKKLLVVITDGKSNDPKEKFENVIPLAESRGIIRYAIGVGKQISKQELKTIASSPKDVFEVNSFEALNSILKQLGEKIFAIEGTNKKSNFTSFQLELSQGGFSAAVTEESILFGAVGSFDWSGGFVEIRGGDLHGTFINASSREPEFADSYLGYALAVAQLAEGRVYFAGAPRHTHRGTVLGFKKGRSAWEVAWRLNGTQLGSYFGAELCVLDVTGDGRTDLLLIGAPLFHEPGTGGEVTVCTIASEGFPNCSSSLRGSPGNEHGRFGTAIAATPDLDGDGIPDLAVGAPHEDERGGSLYIFLGHRRGVHTQHSQKVQGASVRSGLQFFGQSVHSAGDLSWDGLADVAVGARGAAVVLRSQPVINVSVAMTFTPNAITENNFHCARPIMSSTQPATIATVCIAITAVHAGKLSSGLSARVNVSVRLEPQAKTSRLLFVPGDPTTHWTGTVNDSACYNISIIVPACISDYSPVPLSGNFTVEGERMKVTDGLRPILTPRCLTTFADQVLLEQVCGEDQVCVSDLGVTINFTSPMVIASPRYTVIVQVAITNLGEDAYGTEMALIYHSALSFTKASVTQSTWRSSLSCSGDDRQVNSTVVRRASCQVSASVLKERAKVTLHAFFTVSHPELLEDHLQLNVSVQSKNENLTLEDNFDSSTVPVLLPVDIVVEDADSTYNIIFLETSQTSSNMEHSYKVKNVGDVDLPVDMTFIVPVELRSGFVWNVSAPADKDCIRLGDLHPTPEQSLNDNRTTSLEKFCNGTLCLHFGCKIDRLTRNQEVTFTFLGNIIRNPESQKNGVQVTAESWSFLSFDERKYIQFPSSSVNRFSVNTVLEVPRQDSLVGIIVGSVIGGLVILIIISLAMAKMGFFKKPETEQNDDKTETKELEMEKETEL
uniref:Integrin alpha-X-like n=1 Tax=Lepisosteus oculatus TaxID=7918 RepID=W5NAV9_LEPOC|nr:PREDICTED: integrin alpha-X-like [Lepisosteus oculatus]